MTSLEATASESARDDERAQQRASELLPEEVAAGGSEAPLEQAAAILAESDERTDEPERTQRESEQTFDDKRMG